MTARQFDSPFLLRTKLNPPRVREGFIVRSRLQDRLERGVDRRLTLVSAPAGYGKSSLVQHWLTMADRRFAWLSLDEHDASLANFIGYLAAAVQTVYPEAVSTTRSLLQGPSLPEARRLADIFLGDLEELPGSLTLVLDDYHVVQSEDVQAFMTRLVQQLPEQVHLVLVSRSDPVLALSKLRGRGQLTEIRGLDLRFTYGEAREFFERNIGGPLADEIVTLVVERTEGWPVGLQLAAVSLRENEDREDFARRFSESGHRLVTDYLLTEVLEDLSEAQRSLMFRTAILNRFCPSLCEVVDEDSAGRADGEAFIKKLWGSNLFLVSLDNEGNWYRYHHLFRDLMRHRLRQTCSKAEIAACHLRASEWFEKEGLLDEAIIHAVEAGDAQRAAQLVEAHINDALNQEDWRHLQRWLEFLPEPLLQRPMLLVAQASLQQFQYKVAAMIPLLEAAERGLDDGTTNYTPDQEVFVRGSIAAHRAMSFVQGSPERNVAMASQALEDLPADALYLRGLAEFWTIYGLQRVGQTQAAVAFAQAALQRQFGRPDARTFRLLLGLGAVHYSETNLSALEAVATTYWQVAQESEQLVSLGWSDFLLGWAHYQRNELDSAACCFNRVIGIRYGAHGRAVIDCYTGLALTLQAQRQDSAALAVARDLRGFLLDRGMVGFLAIADALMLRLAIGQGNQRIMPRAFADPVTQMALDLWLLPALTEIQASLADPVRGQLDAAQETLRICRGLAEDWHSTRRLLEIGAMETLLHAARGEKGAALITLRETVSLGEAGGALRVFVDAGRGLRSYLRQLLDEGFARDYVRQILHTFDTPTLEAPKPALAPVLDVESQGHARALDGLLTNREVDVLLLVEQRLTNKEIAARLAISPDTVKKHTISVHRKLGVKNRRQAVARARALGILPENSWTEFS
ncbi:MAG: LuxR C-terminal-related transcriptional regulator [Chloroflexota bacterium]|nr:LuxR C-terminal-related transcriptional regulator [Chloroflexota bacterium]